MDKVEKMIKKWVFYLDCIRSLLLFDFDSFFLDNQRQLAYLALQQIYPINESLRDEVHSAEFHELVEFFLLFLVSFPPFF